MIDLRIFESTDDRVRVPLPCGVTAVFRPLAPNELRDARRAAGPYPKFGAKVAEGLPGLDAERELDRLRRDDPDAYAAHEHYTDWTFDTAVRIAAASLVSLDAWPGWTSSGPADAYARLMGIEDEEAMGRLVGECYAATAKLRELVAEGKAGWVSPSGSPTATPALPGDDGAKDAPPS